MLEFELLTDMEVGCVAVSAFPLVIFAPDSVEQQLFECLLQYFDDCRDNSSSDAACKLLVQ